MKVRGTNVFLSRLMMKMAGGKLMEVIVKTIHQLRLIIEDIAVSGIWVITGLILFLFLLLLGMLSFEEAICTFVETCPPPAESDVYVD
jgi:hypothetical protein